MMGYDEAFRSVLVSSPAKLSLQAKHLVLAQEDKQAKIFLKDIHSLILESQQNHHHLRPALCFVCA